MKLRDFFNNLSEEVKDFECDSLVIVMNQELGNDIVKTQVNMLDAESKTSEETIVECFNNAIATALVTGPYAETLH
jgi:hypothetical protein